MNYIAGFLLLVMPEEKAFVVLCYIVEHLLRDYFSKSMVGIVVDQRVLEYFVEKKLPRIHQAMERVSFPIQVISLRWLMCLFVNSLPTDVITLISISCMSF